LHRWKTRNYDQAHGINTSIPHPHQVLDRLLGLTKKVIVVVIAIVAALMVTIGDLIFDTTPYIWEKEDLLNFFSFLLLAIIGLELLDTIYGLIKGSKVHVETVLLVAATAVARELIVYNYEKAQGEVLIGIGVVMGGIAIAYCLVRKAEVAKRTIDTDAAHH
jgi:uncharacterized membrane protein (DUF373 family)